MTKSLEALISSEIADFFCGVVEIHTELGGPNTVEEAQQQLTERVIRIATECEVALIAALEQAQSEAKEFRHRLRNEQAITEDADKRIAELQEQKDKWAAWAIALGAKADVLGARPLCVKLPDGFGPAVTHVGQQSITYKAIMSIKGDWLHKDMVIEAIRAAGGAVEGE